MPSPESTKLVGLMSNHNELSKTFQHEYLQNISKTRPHSLTDALRTFWNESLQNITERTYSLHLRTTVLSTCHNECSGHIPNRVIITTQTVPEYSQNDNDKWYATFPNRYPQYKFILPVWALFKIDLSFLVQSQTDRF